MITLSTLCVLFGAYATACLLHEIGHFLAARLFGIRVDRLFLFYDAGGLALFRCRIGGTLFGIGWLPTGAYISLSGMNPLDSSPTDRMRFHSRPTHVRLLVLAAGVLMNFGTAAASVVVAWWVGEIPPLFVLALAVISTGLGVVNLIPAPGTDGYLLLRVLRSKWR